jgi:hypothetical protein
MVKNLMKRPKDPGRVRSKLLRGLKKQNPTRICVRRRGGVIISPETLYNLTEGRGRGGGAVEGRPGWFGFSTGGGGEQGESAHPKPSGESINRGTSTAAIIVKRNM